MDLHDIMLKGNSQSPKVLYDMILLYNILEKKFIEMEYRLVVARVKEMEDLGGKQVCL